MAASWIYYSMLWLKAQVTVFSSIFPYCSPFPVASVNRWLHTFQTEIKKALDVPSSPRWDTQQLLNYTRASRLLWSNWLTWIPKRTEAGQGGEGQLNLTKTSKFIHSFLLKCLPSSHHKDHTYSFIKSSLRSSTVHSNVFLILTLLTISVYII